MTFYEMRARHCLGLSANKYCFGGRAGHHARSSSANVADVDVHVASGHVWLDDDCRT